MATDTTRKPWDSDLDIPTDSTRKPWDTAPSRDLGLDDLRLSVRHGHAGNEGAGRPRLVEAITDPRPVHWTRQPPPPPPGAPGDLPPYIPREYFPYIRPEILERYGQPAPSMPPMAPYPPQPLYSRPAPRWAGDPTMPPEIPPQYWPYIRPEIRERYDYYPVPQAPANPLPPYIPRPPNAGPPRTDPRLIDTIDRMVDDRLRAASRSAEAVGSTVPLGREYRRYVRSKSPRRSPSPSRRSRTPKTPMVGRIFTQNPGDEDLLRISPDPRQPHQWWEKPIWSDRSVGLSAPPLPREPGWGTQPPPPAPYPGYREPLLHLGLTDNGRAWRDSLYYSRHPVIY